MKTLLFILFLIIPSAVLADQSRTRTVFESENKKFKFRLTNAGKVFNKPFENEKWSLIHKPSEKEIYKIESNKYLWSKIALVSNDGQSVVAVDDYSIREYKDNPEVLTFYHQGKKVKSYKLTELYDKDVLTHATVSHFRWSNFYEDEGEIKKSKFKLITFELNHFTFDVKTGKIIEKKRDKNLTNDSVFVLGQVERISKNLYEITVVCDIFGNISKDEKTQFIFESKSGEYNTYTYYPIIIKDRNIIRNKHISPVNGCDPKSSFASK